jgi:hypothetical protein
MERLQQVSAPQMSYRLPKLRYDGRSLRTGYG